MSRQREAHKEVAKDISSLTSRIAQLEQSESQRLRIEEKLRRSQRLLNETGRMARVGGWYYDPATSTKNWTDEVYRILGLGRDYSPDQIFPFDFLSPEWRPLTEQAFQQAVKQGKSFDLEVQITTARGERRWVQFIGRPKVVDGRTVELCGTVQDITESKQAQLELADSQERLRRSEQRYRELIDSISDLIYTQDMDGHFTSVNASLATILGYSRKYLLGRRATDFMKPQFREAYETEYLEQLKTQGEHSGVSLYYARDGSRRYIEHKSRLVRPALGEPFISGMGRDITDRVVKKKQLDRMRDQLLQSRKMEALGTLAGGIAHDFNNILTAILGYADLALMQIRDGQEVAGEIKSILDVGMRARDLVHRILTFSRKVKMDAKPLHLNQVVEQAIRLLERTIVRMINIKLELAEDLWPIMGDSTQLVQVLLNLGGNAADAMPDGGQLQIKTVNRTMEPDHPSLYGDLPPGRYVELVVSDTGCGMDAKTLEQMFDPFYTTKGSGKGTGLGLSTVYGIVKSHQGQIICHSQPSEGTTFHVLLPAPPLDSVVDQEPDGPTEAPMGEGETILVVDDEPPVREVLNSILNNYGYRPICTPDAESGLEKLSHDASEAKLVILDLNMPGMGGHKMLKELQRIAPNLPVIIASGHLPDGDIPSLIKAGKVDFIPKPFRWSELLKVVRRRLDGEPGSPS